MCNLLHNLFKVGRKITSKKSPSKDETFEALDFILSVIKEHDKDLEKVVKKIVSARKALGDDGELKGRLAEIEEKLDRLQKDLNLLKSLAASTQ